MKSRMTMNVLVSLLTLAGCNPVSAPETSPVDDKLIIGEDERQTLVDPTYADTVGLVVGSPSGYCTGFVSGAHEIITAAHCYQEPSASGPGSQGYQFITGSGSKISLGKPSRIDASKDFAVFTVEPGFERWLTFGTVGTSQGELKIVSFDREDGELVTQDGCAFTQDAAEPGLLLHECDTRPGASGSPILQDGKVVGIHIGYVKDLDRNLAVSASALQDPSVDLARFPFDWEEEVSCHTNCNDRARFEFPCGVRSCSIRGCKTKYCTGTNPGLLATCELEKSRQCNKDAWCAVDVISTAVNGYECYACIVALIATEGVAAGAIGVACAYKCGTTAANLASAIEQCR